MQIGLGLIGQLCFGVISQDSLSFKMMVGCLWGEEPMKHTETVVLYPQWNLVTVAFLTQLKGNLNKDGYVDILSNSAIPSTHLGYGDNFIFKDDGAPCHRANVVKQWKSDQNMRCLEWVLISLIEILWRDLGEAVRNARCHNFNELQQALVNEWSQSPVRRCQWLIRSMTNRIRAVIQARGGYTKYWLSIQLTSQY